MPYEITDEMLAGVIPESVVEIIRKQAIAEVEEALIGEAATIAFLRAVQAVRPEPNIRALEYEHGIRAAVATLKGADGGSETKK